MELPIPPLERAGGSLCQDVSRSPVESRSRPFRPPPPVFTRQDKDQHTMETDQLPSPDETISISSGTNNEFEALGGSILSELSETDGSLVANAEEIFSISEGVQMFFISPEGYVSAPSYANALKIFKFTDQSTTASNTELPQAFLQVGNWMYPMFSGATPVLQSDYGAYIFPDICSSTAGAAVGLILPDFIPLGERQQFEGMLRTFSIMRQQEVVQMDPIPKGQGKEAMQEKRTREKQVSKDKPKPKPTMKSKGLTAAATGYISLGVEKASVLIQKGSEKIRTRLSPEEKPKYVDPRVLKGAEYVRVGSHVAVVVSSLIVTNQGQSTVALAKETVPQVRKHGVKILLTSLKDPSSDGNDGKTIKGSPFAPFGLKAFGALYASLEEAAKTLGRNLADETVNLVTHKYGDDAGELAEHTLYSAGNITMTAYNVNNLGVKTFAQTAAKDTKKAVLHDFERIKESQ